MSEKKRGGARSGGNWQNNRIQHTHLSEGTCSKSSKRSKRTQYYS